MKIKRDEVDPTAKHCARDGGGTPSGCATLPPVKGPHYSLNRRLDGLYSSSRCNKKVKLSQ
jgi:hypothetical protein